MKSVLVALEQTLTGVVLVEIEDDEPDEAARRYVEDEPGEYRPIWENGSIKALSSWVAGEPCALEGTRGFLWCEAHLASAKEGDAQCFHARELEWLAGVGVRA